MNVITIQKEAMNLIEWVGYMRGLGEREGKGEITEI